MSENEYYTLYDHKYKESYFFEFLFSIENEEFYYDINFKNGTYAIKYKTGENQHEQLLEIVKDTIDITYENYSELSSGFKSIVNHYISEFFYNIQRNILMDSRHKKIKHLFEKPINRDFVKVFLSSTDEEFYNNLNKDEILKLLQKRQHDKFFKLIKFKKFRYYSIRY